MAENRSEAFNKAFENIHVTGAVEPGYFDKYEDPVKRLGEFQKAVRKHAIGLFSKSGASPENLKALNTVVLHTGNVFKVPGTSAVHVPEDSSIHLNINSPKVLESVRHELGHHVANHKDPNELAEKVKPKKQMYILGSQEAEADHFANPHSMRTNTYAHAAMAHVNGTCTKDHKTFSHKQLKHLGQGYLDTMKQINPTIHSQLTGGVSND